MHRFWLVVLGALGFLVGTGACGEQTPSAPRQEIREPVGAKQGPIEESPEAAANVQDWPCWRGPHQDGISRETNWLKDWRENKPTVLWKREVGIGYSSMVVRNQRVYTLGHQQGQEHVWCLDARTGEPLWQKSYPGKLVDNLHKGGPGSTPTLDGSRLFTLGREGQLHCYQADDGKLLWSHQLQQLLQVGLPEWGFTCSPLVVGDAVVVDAGWIAAFDRKDGRLLWKTGPFRPGYGTPVAFRDSQGRQLLAVLTNDALVVLHAKDGQEIARQKWETDYVTSSTTPIVHQGHIFISTGYGRGCALFKLEGNQLRRIYAHNKMANHMNTCVLWQGHLYGIHGNSHSRRQCRLVCMEWATGKIRWQQRGFGCGAWMLADGVLIVLADDGRLCLVEATPEEFRPLGEVQVLEETCWTVPVLAGGVIYCRNDLGTLVAVDVRRSP